MKRINRYLASYLRNRFRKSVREASETELTHFLDQNGWILYDTETMLRDFIAWRGKAAVDSKSDVMVLP